MSLEGQYPGGTTHLVTGPGVVMLQLIVNVAFGQVSGVTEIQSGTPDASTVQFISIVHLLSHKRMIRLNLCTQMLTQCISDWVQYNPTSIHTSIANHDGVQYEIYWWPARNRIWQSLQWWIRLIENTTMSLLVKPVDISKE